MSHRRTFLKRATVLAGSAVLTAALALASPQLLAQGKTVKIGVLHSLSGTMAISETVLKDVTLMAIDQINAKGDYSDAIAADLKKLCEAFKKTGTF